MTPSEMRERAKKALELGGSGNETAAALWHVAAALQEATLAIDALGKAARQNKKLEAP